MSHTGIITIEWLGNSNLREKVNARVRVTGKRKVKRLHLAHAEKTPGHFKGKVENMPEALKGKAEMPPNIHKTPRIVTFRAYFTTFRKSR